MGYDGIRYMIFHHIRWLYNVIYPIHIAIISYYIIFISDILENYMALGFFSSHRSKSPRTVLEVRSRQTTTPCQPSNVWQWPTSSWPMWKCCGRPHGTSGGPTWWMFFYGWGIQRNITVVFFVLLGKWAVLVEVMYNYLII